jgi:MoxR-like ATPase
MNPTIRTDRYVGNGKPNTGDPPLPHPYLADDRLAKAVNMAIVLGRPLLIKGPPGCGKTRLADSIAHELQLGEPHRWYVKSTSRARDGLYTIDMVRRLYDAQLQTPKERDRATDARRLAPYLRFGPLGEAIRAKNECVVLIDEIDKADLDFPNDLLRELDEMKFTIEELDPAEAKASKGAIARDYAASPGARPVIVITSNDEKELPEAFLRRCLFHYISFPSPTELRKIVELNTRDLDVEKVLLGRFNLLVERAAERFRDVRDRGQKWRKSPGPSELIDWVRILHHWGVHPEKLQPVEKITDLPDWRVLFKHQQDHDQAERAPVLAKPPQPPHL